MTPIFYKELAAQTQILTWQQAVLKGEEGQQEEEKHLTTVGSTEDGPARDHRTACPLDTLCPLAFGTWTSGARKGDYMSTASGRREKTKAGPDRGAQEGSTCPRVSRRQSRVEARVSRLPAPRSSLPRGVGTSCPSQGPQSWGRAGSAEIGSQR